MHVCTCTAHVYIHLFVHVLHMSISTPPPPPPSSSSQLAPTQTESLITAMRYTKNPAMACESLYQQIRALTREIREKMASQPQCELHTCVYACSLFACISCILYLGFNQLPELHIHVHVHGTLHHSGGVEYQPRNLVVVGLRPVQGSSSVPFYTGYTCTMYILYM